mmetsp:Transcript_4041/g.12143  ORF Transcript_4041/g.12143 Transcript_4041/m.12143 type:complete len:294 (-) Transcript_4041:277-1158(-)|eukprot:CAMPEP_0198724954 /NCGR_PEP_ID=MMETSP1475-20131203/2333_1 /TAXON_ID= ORGANISM="Unidentified sp., Strain CCMP1999" /NCGR_SAMPLE_ID=MMETSP1475 /ASSEMBLY_ACC=CAM_ASM_001111 /LENGTH=293 /DNA_ID=CAMNT_0044486603 /DNA_START=223 /DNA_END=1104 /DNA_ORIENTATION=-
MLQLENIRSRRAGSDYLTIGPFGIRFPEPPVVIADAARTSVGYFVDNAMESAQNAFLKPVNEAVSLDGESLTELTSSLYKQFESVESESGWIQIKAEKGIKVWRKRAGSKPGGSRRAKLENKLHVVKAEGVINAPPKKVYEVFTDNSRIFEFNKLCSAIKDLEIVNNDTKIVWSSSRQLGPFRPRDFVTLVHTKKRSPGTYMVLSRAVEVAEARPTKEYVRGEILLAGHLMAPVPGKPSKTKFSTIVQVNPGGFAESLLGMRIINRLCSSGPFNFILNLERAALRRPRKAKSA